MGKVVCALVVHFMAAEPHFVLLLLLLTVCLFLDDTAVGDMIVVEGGRAIGADEEEEEALADAVSVALVKSRNPLVADQRTTDHWKDRWVLFCSRKRIVLIIHRTWTWAAC